MENVWKNRKVKEKLKNIFKKGSGIMEKVQKK